LRHPSPGQTLPDEREPFLDEPESDFDIREYLGMVRRHWKLVAAVCLVTLTGALVHYSISPKLYQAAAIIQIERRNLTPLTTSGQNPWFENYWNMEYYPTQYELLKSRGLAERVVRNLELLEEPAYNAGADLAGGGDASPTAEDDEAAVARLAEGLRAGLSVDPVRNTQLVQLSYRSSSPEFAARAANAFAEAFIDLGVESRYATAGKASSFLGTQIESLKEEIQDKELQLQAFSRSSDIVTMDPASNVTLQRLESLNASYIDAKKLRIERESRYQELLHTPPEAVADSLSGGGVVADLRGQQIRQEREYETKLKTYKPDWPAMVSLKAEIDKGRQNLESVVRELVQQARSAGLAEYQTALRQEQSLAAELEKAKSEAINQNSAAVEYTNLKVEIETRRDLLDELLRRQSETEVAARLQDTRESNIRVIDRALTPGGAYSPSLRKDVTYGLLLGLLVGVGCAFLLEFLDRTIKSPEELERRLKLPVLALIHDLADAGRSGYGYYYSAGAVYGAEPSEGPRVRPVRTPPASWLEKKKGATAVAAAAAQIELVPHARPRTLASEAYRSLRTALLLSTARELKVVAVTSAVAGEGKTATATNLAVVLAQLGRPVLIVDCDLRKPRLHQVFQVSNRVGLVHLLTAAAETDSVILPTEVPNLYMVPSGPIPPNPSELLASDRMRDWLGSMRGRFEYVIVDTPPVLAVTDSTIIGAQTDGVVLTLRAGKVTREEARLCRDRLRLADIRVLGAVLNRYRSLQATFGRRYRTYEDYVAEENAATPRAGSAA
jgi:polysaccharide biosynthesis transport protein